MSSFNLLKVIYHKLPLIYKVLIQNIYLTLKIKKIYTSPDCFPINYYQDLNSPIFKKSKHVGYFFRPYQEKKQNYLLCPEDLYKYKYELIYGENIYNTTYEISTKYDCVIPISIEKENKKIKIECKKNETIVSSTELKNMPAERYHYFNFKEKVKIKIETDSNLIIGKPISTKQITKNKKKLVLCIFIDSLVDLSLISQNGFEDIMPNTTDFFSNGITFKNHFTNAEWTLPSVPSFFTGQRHQGHSFFHPKKSHSFGREKPLISEIFSLNDYLTFQINSNWRMSPGYGYVKGFDRSIYKREMDVQEITFSFLEHMRTFTNRDHFVWLSFVDIHHQLKMIPDINNQIRNSFGAHCVTPWYDSDNKNKSVFREKDIFLTEIYLNEIKRLDFYLKYIYDYVEKNYEVNETVINLISDHSQAFLTNDQHPLSLYRTKVPWMFRGDINERKYSKDLSENIDIYNSLIYSCGLNSDEDYIINKVPRALGGKQKKDYLLSQSIYPNQTYKAVIRDTKHEYRYASKTPVSPNGFIPDNVELELFEETDYIVKQRNNHEDLKDNNNYSFDIKNKYYNLVKELVDEWNINLN